MNWFATKIGFGIILVNLLATLQAYGAGAHGPIFGMTSAALLAVPALLAVDLIRYAVYCWQQDCLAD